MSNSGGFALTRTHGSDRFYNPPPVRRHQQLLLQQQQQQKQKRQLHSQKEVKPETRVDSDESTLSRPNSVCSASSSNADSTNLDRLIESVTPFVPAQFFSELCDTCICRDGKPFGSARTFQPDQKVAAAEMARMRGRRNREADIHSFFSLGDLWESFREWSVYGVGVPLLLNGGDSVKQYYVPSLSGIQLYTDPHRLRRPGEDSDAESSRETSSAGSSDCEAERRAKSIVDGLQGQHDLMSLNNQRMSRLTLREKPPLSSSGDETEVCSSPGKIVFEYFEQEQPHHRQPLYDKISNLATQFPELRLYRSCDLLPTSWVSVAWYPIYRIPVGPTLQSLDASFLTFHSLSTHSRSKNKPQFHASSGRKVHRVGESSKISLPVFGLASYKLRGSILTPGGACESQQANSLLQAADNCLRRLQVNLPDFQFFVSHNSQWR